MIALPLAIFPAEKSCYQDLKLHTEDRQMEGQTSFYFVVQMQKYSFRLRLKKKLMSKRWKCLYKVDLCYVFWFLFSDKINVLSIGV